jgi:AraC-like DNA-binding protein
MPSSAVRTFADPDDWTTTFRGSEAELTITARGRFSAKLTWIRLHCLQMQRFFDNLPRILHVAHVHRRATISFLAPQGSPQRWGGIELTPGDIMLHNLDQNHFQQTSGVASSGFMSLPVEDFVSAGATMVGCDLTPPKDSSIFRPPPHALAKLRRLHAVAGYLAEEAPKVIANPDAAYGLEQALIEAMVGCLGNNEAREDSVAQRQHELIMRRFRRVVEENPDQPLYIPELCRAIGVSERTLRVCCQEQLGVGPKRYLLFRRLHLARRALRKGLPDTTTVTEIATRYGFWHFGRFAGEYQSLFGEPPSSTLHRKAK